MHLRTRPGFYGIPDGSPPPVGRTREEQLKAAITSPFGATEVPVQFGAQVVSLGGNKFVARLRLRIDVRDLTFQDQPDGSKKSTAELLALAYGDNGKVVGSVDGTLNGKFQPEQVSAARTTTWIFPSMRPAAIRSELLCAIRPRKRSARPASLWRFPTCVTTGLPSQGSF
jgi:hypothetical protein